jgi:hemerythrin superfamily protein
MAESHDVVDLLKEDHRRLEGLLEQLDREQDPSELRSIYLHIVGELAAHEACEQQVVFPAVRASVPAAATDVVASLGQHEEINSLLDEMVALDPSCFGFMKRASALALELRAHFGEEEEVFDRLRAALEPAELADLARQARTAKSCAPAFPAAVHSGAASLAGGVV